MSGNIPEIPSFVHFVYKNYQDTFLGSFLNKWEVFVFSILAALSISLFAFFALRKQALVPSGIQNALEWGFETFQNLISEILGPHGKKHLPFLGTLFIYILTMNFIGLIPLMKSPSANLNITAALAIVVFFYVQYLNIRNRGILGFLYHLAGSPTGILQWLLVPVLMPLELLSQISRPMTLALRLFGNMMGEHILLGVFATLGMVWVANYAITIMIPLQIPVVFLALLTGFMQALVFTMLSTIYILLSIPHKTSNKEER